MILKLIHRLRKYFAKRGEWDYGTCNNQPARRHRVNGNVQFIIWKKGDQKYVDGIGHTEDKWVDYHRSRWGAFTPNEHKYNH